MLGCKAYSCTRCHPDAFAAAPSGLLKRGKRVSLCSVLLWFKGDPKPLHGSGALGLRGLGFTTSG